MTGDQAAEPGAGQDSPPDRPHPPRLWRRQWLAALLPMGFLIGVIGGFMQESRITISGVAIPWGSALIIATLVATIRAASLNIGTRLAGVLLYGGWLIATVLMALPNPSGDVVFTADAGALGYLMAGCVLGAAAAAWPLFLDLPSGSDDLNGPSAPGSEQDAQVSSP